MKHTQITKVDVELALNAIDAEGIPAGRSATKWKYQDNGMKPTGRLNIRVRDGLSVVRLFPSPVARAYA